MFHFLQQDISCQGKSYEIEYFKTVIFHIAMCNSAASHLIMKCDMSMNHFDGAHYLVRNDQEFETGENKANFLQSYNKQ